MNNYHHSIIRNNIIRNNSSHAIQAWGGGIGIHGGAVLVEHNSILNNVIANNEAGNIGGGLYSFETRANIFSNLIFNNKARQYGVNIGTEGENDLDMIYNQIWTGDNWIATYDGMAKFSLGQKGINGFHPPEGIRIPLFENAFSLNPATGEIHFGKREGMISFDPKEVPLNGFIAPSVILDYNSYGDPDSTSADYRIQRAFHQRFRLDLPLGKTFMMYKFATLDFTSPSNSLYRFYMKDSGEDTLLARKTQSASYGDLKQGRYTF